MDVFNSMYETWILQAYQFNLSVSTEYPNLTLIDFVQVFITSKLYTKQFNLFEP